MNRCKGCDRQPRRARPAFVSGLLVLLVAVPAAVAPPTVGAGRVRRSEPEATTSQATKDPGAVRRQLETIRQQIVALEAQRGQLQQQRTTLVEEFEAADIELALSRRRLELLRIRLRALAEEVPARQGEVDRLSASLAEARAALSARVVALYRMGPLSYSRFLLAAESTEQVLASYQLVVRLAAHDRALVNSVQSRLEELQRAVASMRTARERLAGLQVEETEAAATLQTRQQERQELIRRIDVEAQANRQALIGRQRSAQALENLLARLVVEDRLPDAGDAAPAKGSNETSSSAATPPAFAATRGTLPWPGEGPVTRAFGRQRHPVYETYTLSNGIEIGAETGSPVRAVYQGRVAFADWFRGYGLVVILSHGGDFFTLYGHLASVRLRVGEYVDPGVQLGEVGDTGSLIGPSLYFEIRQGAEALDPGGWLRGR